MDYGRDPHALSQRASSTGDDDGASVDLAQAARAAFELADSLDWKSHDPFDLLFSPYTRPVRAISSYASRTIVHLGRRTGTRVRRLLKVPPHEEAKAIADYLRAAVALDEQGVDWATPYVAELSGRLLARSLSSPAGRAWGLEFPYVSRFGSVGSKTPNIYTTTAACQALLDAYRLTGSSVALDAAGEGAHFILNGLGSFELGGRRWLRYFPHLDAPIVNVQASSASLFAEMGAQMGEEGFLETADQAAETVVASQRADASWPYSEDGRGSFVDGFHTGFTLEALTEYIRFRQGDAIQGADEALRAGFAYFKEHLVTADGLPRGLADRRISLDGQNVAQCVQTLAVCGGKPEDVRNALRLWRMELEPLLLGRGRQAYTALRWTWGPAVVATSHLLSACAGSRDPDGNVTS